MHISLKTIDYNFKTLTVYEKANLEYCKDYYIKHDRNTTFIFLKPDAINVWLMQ